jgi:hypothetical protein
MAALVHIAAGFASKPLSRKVPVWVLIIATEVLDILAIIFALIGIEKTGYIPWSHGLAMSLAWSIAFGALAIWIFRNYRVGIFIGCLVFSHWLIDFVTHPMGAVFGGRPIEPDLPLLFGGSPKVGLGLYNYSIVLAYIIEYGTIVIGIGVYAIHTLNQRRIRKAERIA